MIGLTQLDGTPFVLNCNLIEKIDNIPETKITLTTGKYYLVTETCEEVVRKVVAYRRHVLKGCFTVRVRGKE